MRIHYNRGMRISRRYFLASAASAAAAAEQTGQGREFPAVAVRYLDPATEFAVVRLTDPNFTAYLPLPKNRIVEQQAILYASDFNGKWDAYRMDLKSGESHQLTDATALDPSSLGFLPGERGFWHVDDGVLVETRFSKFRGLKSRVVYRTPLGFESAPGIGYSEDGQYAAFVERASVKAATGSGTARYRLLVVRLKNGQARTVVEAAEEIGDILIRPRHSSLFVRMGGQPTAINFDGTGSRRFTLAEGEIGQEQWIADGQVLLYLSRPPGPGKLTVIREFNPESGQDLQIAGTSQYVHFHANPDASVFVGASGSKASPYVLLLARAAKREFTLAEHRASDSRMVAPAFTPNSQSILFVSDRHGKPAIYYMPVDKLVAETDGS
jgi:oligogalacturonide lyase